jgi:putative SOS response-associated peptidase YedK
MKPGAFEGIRQQYPDWTKDEKNVFSTFNLRVETSLTSIAFRNALGKRRCLVPVNGFYAASAWAERE